MAKKLNINTVVPKILMEPVAQGDSRYIRCSILIVCEGEKTEPNYFKSFSMMKNSSGFVYDISTDGGGISTLKVVEKAIELREKAVAQGKPFDAVWAVFDRDSFKPDDFDNAIKKAEASGIGCAWSNEAFELWYVYHFDNRITPMSRTAYKGVITKRVRAKGYRKGNKDYTYKKNDTEMRKILSACGCDENLAIRNAEQQASTFNDRKYHDHNPCTMVFKLVRLLKGGDKDFNRLIKKKVNEN